MPIFSSDQTSIGQGEKLETQFPEARHVIRRSTTTKIRRTETQQNLTLRRATLEKLENLQRTKNFLFFGLIIRTFANQWKISIYGPATCLVTDSEAVGVLRANIIETSKVLDRPENFRKILLNATTAASWETN